MSNAPWFAGAVVVDLENRKLLVIDYSRDPSIPGQTKFVGGAAKEENGHKDRTPRETLAREVDQELFGRGVGRITSVREFYVEEVLNDQGNCYPPHKKHFFLVTLEGNLRKEILREDENDGHYEVLSPPYWIDVVELAGKIHGAHARALLTLCKALAPKIQEFAWAQETLEGRGF